MALTENSKKYWHQIRSVHEYLFNVVIKPSDRVLEVGPGECPFPRADMYVDFVDIPGLNNLIKCDLATDTLPFKDKEFDFVYARQILEDMFNPFHLIREMSRVSKAGYIECPSPAVELGRGVDCHSPPYRGFYHHRWIVWMFGKELRLIPKYPFMEYLKFDEERTDKILEQERYWNTYCLWQDEIIVRHMQHPIDYSIPRDYGMILGQAIERSIESTDVFFASITK
jgi:hypothetical protein